MLGGGLVLFALGIQSPGQARGQTPQHAPGRVVADSFWSQALGIRKRAMIWLPPSYASEPSKRFPVAYYLHGANGNETQWLNQAQLGVALDSLVAAGMPEMIVVMPDGDNGFYTTWNFLGDWAGCRRNRPPNAEPAESYCVPWPHYDDYIARDLVAFVDRSYRTLAERRHRGLAGLSMGGYGAITLALSYPEVFSAAASHSGVLAPARGGGRAPVPADRFDLALLRASWSPGLWDIAAPVFGSDSVGWAARDPAVLYERARRRYRGVLPALYVDCGTDDPFLHQNRAFRDAIAASGGHILYREHPGAHTWAYWRTHGPASAAWLAARLAVP